jgi:hypothetical protein
LVLDALRSTQSGKAATKNISTTDFPERQSRNQKDFEQEETEETESGKKSSQKCTIPSFSVTDFTNKKNSFPIRVIRVIRVIRGKKSFQKRAIFSCIGPIGEWTGELELLKVVFQSP